jgi:diketogulonate reductase-like aldo/keto reductase
MTSNPLAAHRIGLGTWMMGESASLVPRDLKAAIHALEIGYRLIDTAEMYASGGAEKVIGRALEHFGRGRRKELTIVSKVLPSNASRAGTVRACEQILSRLGCEYLDIYLLHWQGSHTYEETLEGFIALKERGLIKHWGISNFDAPDFMDWLNVEASMKVSHACVTNQVYYSLQARGIEFDLLPAMRKKQVMLMAYTPLGSGRLANDARLAKIAEPLGLTTAQLALAWVIRGPGVVAIPKSSDPKRLEENLAASEIRLDTKTLAEIDQLFSPPKRKTALAMV